MKGPKFGAVEVERNGIWEKSLKFTSEEMKKYKVRYKYLNSVSSHDEFQVKQFDGNSINLIRLYFSIGRL